MSNTQVRFFWLNDVIESGCMANSPYFWVVSKDVHEPMAQVINRRVHDHGNRG